MPKHRVRSDNEEWGDLEPSCVNRGFSKKIYPQNTRPKVFQTRPCTSYEKDASKIRKLGTFFIRGFVVFRLYEASEAGNFRRTKR